jgi:hypothetical protein
MFPVLKFAKDLSPFFLFCLKITNKEIITAITSILKLISILKIKLNIIIIPPINNRTRYYAKVILK